MLVRKQQKLLKTSYVIFTLPWPARSPNLSPVEHVWDQLKRQVPSCHSVHDLELAVQDLKKLLKIKTDSVPEPGAIGNVIEEVVDLAKQINLEIDNDDVQELLDSHNQESTIVELTEMHKQDIEELLSED
ncbi:hypothetical protein TNCV_3681901 [Trichonephila clavipes]|uniref:Tc1-like transposase DDE domain-containing protein n=1 Tax=Trichonephila clavipes TaxID=2585209 RepID=A0A8X6V3A3_TRICX|nr:hypothetical protein TNCV_3681901 [Trichonephila clavipes]